MSLPRGSISATLRWASAYGETLAVGSILMPSISKVGGPHSVGTSLISEVVKRATGSKPSPVQWYTVLSLQVSSQGKRSPCEVHPAASTSTVVRERSRSSEHSHVGAPARAAARSTSCVFRVNSGPVTGGSSRRIREHACVRLFNKLALHRHHGVGAKPVSFPPGQSHSPA